VPVGSVSIDSAWLEKGDAAPGTTCGCAFCCIHPAGPGRIEKRRLHVPVKWHAGTTLRILITDGATLAPCLARLRFAALRTFRDLTSSWRSQSRAPKRPACSRTLYAFADYSVGRQELFPIFRFPPINVLDGRPTPGKLQWLRESLA